MHIAIKVKDDGVTMLVNGKEVIKPSEFKMTYGGACKMCGVPADLRFNTITFNNVTNDAATLEKMKGPKPLWLAVAVPFATKADGTSEYELYTAVTQNINYDYIYNYFFAPEKVKDKPYTPSNADELVLQPRWQYAFFYNDTGR